MMKMWSAFFLYPISLENRDSFELLSHANVLVKYTFNTWMPLLELEIQHDVFELNPIELT